MESNGIRLGGDLMGIHQDNGHTPDGFVCNCGRPVPSGSLSHCQGKFLCHDLWSMAVSKVLKRDGGNDWKIPGTTMDTCF